MKIVILGAGSYVFTPTALRDAIEKHRLDDADILLVDLDPAAAETMCACGRRMAADLGVACRLAALTDRRAALPGADAVILCAALEGARRWTMDYDILLRHGLPDQARECGGLGGLAHAVRSITLALAVARDMEALCPRADLLDVTNPMPRVVTALRRFSSLRAFGFCNAAQGGRSGYERAAQWALGAAPGPEAVAAAANLAVVTAGLNHFAWFLSVRDRRSGADLMPRMAESVARGQDRAHALLRRWQARYGGLAACAPDHTAEFLPQEPDARYHTHPPYHGTPAERRDRWRELRQVAAGRLHWRRAETLVSWEHPVDFAVALARRQSLDLPMLNFPNDGCIPSLPAGRIVEAPARLEGGKLAGLPVVLPPRVAELCRVVSDVHELVAEGVARHDRRLLRRAVEADPAVADKAPALAALDDLLDAHADLCPFPR